MPASLVVKTSFYLWNMVTFWLNEHLPWAKQQHEARVRRIQAAIRAWIDGGRKTKLCSARPGWKTMSLRIGKYKASSTGIPVNDLSHILTVNTADRFVHVEPNVTMGQITATLNELGWTLPVLPELDDLTVGGLVCGVGVETSSHKFGTFQHICKEFEVVLADASVVVCSASENSDLFRAVPWSHGTLGFLVGVKLSIIPAASHVQLHYEPITSKHVFEQRCKELFSSQYDFVEALVFSQTEFVMMYGNMTSKIETSLLNSIGRYYKPWFYTHVESFLKTGPATEYIPLRDYYHRHTRSLFWEIRDIVSFGNHPVFRYLFGWLMPPHIALMKRTQTEELRQLYEKHHVVQDMLIPLSALGKSLTVIHEEFDVYPLWICPMRIFKEDAGFISPTSTGEEMFVDVGIYGVPGAKKFKAVESTRAVEDFVRSVQGFQMLYADMYHTREEFRQMFHHETYDRVRKALHADKAFPEVYDKVCKANRH